MKPFILARIFASAQEGPSKQPTREELILEFTSRDVKQPRAIVERIARRELRKQRSYGNGFISLDDIRGELTVSLIRLIDRYEDGRSDSLDAFIAQHLAWRAVDAVVNSRVMRDTQEPCVNASGQEAVCAVDLPSSMGVEYSARGRRRGRDGVMHSIPMHQDSRAGLDVAALIGQLGPADRAVMETYLAMMTEGELAGESADLTQLEVATEMGISRATVNRAINKLRPLVTQARNRGDSVSRRKR